MTHVDWHPYPEEKPKFDGLYLVTFRGYVDDVNYYLNVDVVGFNGRFPEFIDQDVDAWAERPEPYTPAKAEDNHPDAITARKYMSGDPETVKALHLFDE